MKRWKWIMIVAFVIVIPTYIVLVTKECPSSQQEIQIATMLNKELPTTPVTKEYTKYAVELSIDEDCKLFEGIAKISYTHSYDRPTQQILINSNFIDIQDIQINSEIVSYEKNDSIIKVESPFEIKRNEELTITVQFTGRLMNRARSSVGMASICGFLPTIPFYSEETGWVDTGSNDVSNTRILEPSDYDVTINTYQGQYPIATGTMDDFSEKDGMITTLFSAKRVRDFGMHIGNQMEREVFNTGQGFSVVLYYMDESCASEKVIPEIIESLNHYCDILGEYPYDQLTVIHQSGMKKGLTYPTLLIGDFEKNQRAYGEINKLAGKQWLGYIIGSSKEACWLSEGLLEYFNKRFSFSESQMSSYIKELKEKQHDYTYNELAVQMLYQIERKLGKERFEEALRAYYKKYSFQMSTGAEFIQLIEKETQMNVGYIHDYWLNKMESKECE